MPSWLLSLAMHVALLLGLAAYHVEPIRDALTKLVIESGPSEDSAEMDSFDVVNETVSSELDEQTEMVAQTIPEQTQFTEVQVEVPVANLAIGPMPDVAIDSLTSQLVPSNVLAATSNQLTQGLTSRSKSNKRELLEKFVEAMIPKKLWPWDSTG